VSPKNVVVAGRVELSDELEEVDVCGGELVVELEVVCAPAAAAHDRQTAVRTAKRCEVVIKLYLQR